MSKIIRSIVFGLLLALASPLAAFAQCSGQAPANTYCGNPTGALAVPGWKPMSGFSVDLDVGSTTITGGTSGGVLYDNAGVLGNTVAPTAQGQMFRSGASVTPGWSTATWPATTTINQLLYSSANNTVTGLATANSSVLVTNGSGVPSLSTTLPSGVLGPTSTSLGNIAFWNSVDGTKLGAAPAYQAANPANAALYSTVANPANGYTTIYNALQVSQGSPITASTQFGSNTVGVQQAIVGTLNIASGDTAGNAGYAIIGYGESNSATTGVVGIGGQSRPGSGGAGTSVWGGNIFASNNYSSAANTGLNLNWLSALELNVGINLKSGAVEPTINQFYGIYLIGSGSSTVNQGVGISVNQLSIGTAAKWSVAFESTGGAAVTGIRLGPTAASGVSLSSQPIVFRGVGGGGGNNDSSIFGDSGGSLILQAKLNANIYLGDTAANYLIVNPTGTGAKMTFNALNGSSAGAIINDTSGNISSAAAGAGKVLAGATPAFTATPTLGVAGSVVGSIAFANATSGTETIQPATGALGSGIATLPAGTYNIVGDSLTQELTAKTLTSSVAKGTWTTSGAWAVSAGTMVDGTNAFALTATMPTTITAVTTAIAFTITGAGSSAFNSNAFSVNYNTGYTGANTTRAANFSNTNAGTASSLVTSTGAVSGNLGFSGAAQAVTTGLNLGAGGFAASGDINVGLAGEAQVAKSGAGTKTNIGVVGSALNAVTGGSTPVQIGGLFVLNQTTTPTVSAALIADNGSQTDAIFLARDNGSTVFTIADGGVVTAAGTTAATSASTGTVVLSGSGAGLGVNGAIWAGTYINVTPTVVNSLPTCNGGTQGARSLVTNNATAIAFNGAVTTGGANITPVFCDGTNWKQG